MKLMFAGAAVFGAGAAVGAAAAAVGLAAAAGAVVGAAAGGAVVGAAAAGGALVGTVVGAAPPPHAASKVAEVSPPPTASKRTSSARLLILTRPSVPTSSRDMSPSYTCGPMGTEQSAGYAERTELSSCARVESVPGPGGGGTSVAGRTINTPRINS